MLSKIEIWTLFRVSSIFAVAGLTLLAVMACGNDSSEPGGSPTAPPGMFSTLPTTESPVAGDQPPTIELNTPEPTFTPQPTPTPNPTYTPVPTFTPLPSATPEPTLAPTGTPVPTATPNPTATPEPTTRASSAPSSNEALCEAVYWGRTEAVQTLVGAGTDVNATCQSASRSYAGKTPLFLAVDESDNAILQNLLNAGADPNVGSSTPLCEAVYWGKTTIARTLVGGGADVNATCKSPQRSYGGKTPVFLAVDEGNNAILQNLLNAGADPNAGSSTPLCEAVYWGKTNIVQTLVDGGVDVNAICMSPQRSYDGKTPVFLAVDENENEILQILTAAGAVA